MKRSFRLFGSIRRKGADTFDRLSPQEAIEEAQRDWLENPDDRIRAEVGSLFASGEISQEQHEKIMAILNDPEAHEEVQTSTTTGPGMTAVRRVVVRTTRDAKPTPDPPDTTQ